jgi:ABC-2 type transport system ATP-binding protein
MEQGAIVINNLTVKFGNFTAINGVSFVVQRGEIFGFLGPNGSGKTTLIKTLCGLIQPTSGKGSILGLDIFGNADEIKERIGYMSQKFGLYEDLSVNENINFYAGVYNIEGAYLRRRKEEVIAFMGLEPYINRRTSTLSGGWKQRLALACAIMHDPEVVFLDEPTAGIDPVARREIWDFIFKLAGRGVTFFVTTHYMDEAERCGCVGYIYYSKLLAYGAPEQLKILPEVSPENSIRLEIICRSPSSALLFVKNLPYVLEATIFGKSIHALIKSPQFMDKLKSDLAEAGFGQVKLETIVPSLEDVFVTLTNFINRTGSLEKKK